ncbi:hypothetical protein SAMD00019534_042710 [Acytostelium subglobosum LB1]|uniref:hypothetical protein n=1 Tax=Acytostelium subglobosum LB1 TaxID=1410327 RepID=UPI00064486EA|nr:hypothetical protein SAMD00019534_042710 [Acytostelium subglobosum LB1]GAM21096.1 hypothetical protein SAMD00019534_042710 [Acytostelium subglobosum LB1]|eukprot:XP_012756230.1 hypothetical protein SAMD00019534_042710 [Acytostelium subglobosum LB1]
MRYPVVLLAAALLLVAFADAHSFLSCVNYDYAQSTCKAYPRNWKYQEVQGDRYLYQLGKFTKPGPTNLGVACGPAQSRASNIYSQYSEKYPMGQFYPGQKLCSQWPARNHATQPRAGNVSFYLGNKKNANNDVDDNQSTFFAHPIAARPFGNCTNYNQNTNNATCTACYEIPANVENGLYTLQWFWEFNPGEYYMTCADILVDKRFQASQPLPQWQTQQQPWQQQQQRNGFATRPHIPQELINYDPYRAQYSNPYNPDYIVDNNPFQVPSIHNQHREREQTGYDNEVETISTPSGDLVLISDGQFNERVVQDASWGPHGVTTRLSATSLQAKQTWIEFIPTNDRAFYVRCQTGACITCKEYGTLHFYVRGPMGVLDDMTVKLVQMDNEVSEFKLTATSQSLAELNDDSFNHFAIDLPYGREYKGLVMSGVSTNTADRVYISKVILGRRLAAAHAAGLI